MYTAESSRRIRVDRVAERAAGVGENEIANIAGSRMSTAL